MKNKLTAAEWKRLRTSRAWQEHDARRVLLAWRASGLSMSAFAREHEIGDERLRWWRNRLGEWGGSSSSASIAFAPATVREDEVPSPGGRAAVVIRLATGELIEADASTVDASWVAALVVGCARRS